MAKRFDCAHVVRYEHKRPTFPDKLGHPLDAPVLEPSIANCNRFINQKDIWFQVRGNREAKPQLHP